MPGPLTGLIVLDLTRVLAGPTATQLLGDFGARVIKIEKTGGGDDARKMGPPFIDTPDGGTDLSTYFAASNRNKESITLDLQQPEGRDLLLKLAAKADILVENSKAGSMERLGLGFDRLHEVNPALIYCSITGFGQTGPYRDRPNYDYLAQAMGGMMSLTGDPEGSPQRVGMGIADIMCGMYAATALLAALHHRNQSGEGQFIDLALLDTQVAWLTYEATAYFETGQPPRRWGDEHPTLVPYKTLPAKDGYFVLASGNNAQFERFLKLAGAPELMEEERFATNQARVVHRDALYPLLADLTQQRTVAQWVEALAEVRVPCGPVNDLPTLFQDPQILAREMAIEMPSAESQKGKIGLLANPIRFSRTPVVYDKAPPRLGADSQKVLTDLLEMTAEEIEDLAARGLI